VECFHQTSVVPVLDNVIRTIVNLHLDCVPSIVYQKDDGVLPPSEHRWHFLCRHLNYSQIKLLPHIFKELNWYRKCKNFHRLVSYLKAAISNAGNDTSILSSLCISYSCTHCPANWSILHLEFVPGESKLLLVTNSMTESISTCWTKVWYHYYIIWNISLLW